VLGAAHGEPVERVVAGEPRFAGDGGPAAAASLRRPSAVLFDAEGSLWVADTSNHRVRKIHRFLDAAPDRR